MKFIMLIAIKMPTIVGILTAIGGLGAVTVVLLLILTHFFIFIYFVWGGGS